MTIILIKIKVATYVGLHHVNWNFEKCFSYQNINEVLIFVLLTSKNSKYKYF